MGYIQAAFYSLPLCSNLHGKERQGSTPYAGFQLNKIPGEIFKEYFTQSLHITRMSTTPSLWWQQMSSSLCHSLLVLIIAFSPWIFPLLSYSIVISAFSSYPSHFPSCSTLLLPWLPSVFSLLLTWVKNPHGIGRMLPNRQEGLAEDNWMYRQLQPVTVLPVSKRQASRGCISWQSRKMMLYPWIAAKAELKSFRTPTLSKGSHWMIQKGKKLSGLTNKTAQRHPWEVTRLSAVSGTSQGFACPAPGALCVSPPWTQRGPCEAGGTGQNKHLYREWLTQKQNRSCN